MRIRCQHEQNRSDGAAGSRKPHGLRASGMGRSFPTGKGDLGQTSIVQHQIFVVVETILFLLKHSHTKVCSPSGTSVNI